MAKRTIHVDHRCDRCGRALPSGGRVLHTGQPYTPATRIGRYGPGCARRIRLYLASTQQPVFVDGPGR